MINLISRRPLVAEANGMVAAYIGERLLVVGAEVQLNGKFGLPLGYPGLLRLSYE